MDNYQLVYLFLLVPIYMLGYTFSKYLIKSDTRWVMHVLPSLLSVVGIYLCNLYLNFYFSRECLFILNSIIVIFTLDVCTDYIFEKQKVIIRKFLLYLIWGLAIWYNKVEWFVFFLPLIYALLSSINSFYRDSRLLFFIDIVLLGLLRILFDSNYNALIPLLFICRFLIFIYHYEWSTEKNLSVVIFEMGWMFSLWYLIHPVSAPAITPYLFNIYLGISFLVFLLFFLAGNDRDLFTRLLIFVFSSTMAFLAKSIITGTAFFIFATILIFLVSIQRTLTTSISNNFNKYFFVTIIGFMLVPLPGSPMFFIFADFVKIANLSVLDIFLFAGWIFIYSLLISITFYKNNIHLKGEQKYWVSGVVLLIILSSLSIFLLSRLTFYQIFSYPVSSAEFFSFKKLVGESGFRFFYITLPFVTTFALILTYSYKKSTIMGKTREWIRLIRISHNLKYREVGDEKDLQLLVKINNIFLIIIKTYSFVVRSLEQALVDLIKILAFTAQKSSKEIQFLLFLSISLLVIVVFLSFTGGAL